jgi:hypothetical protein
MTPKEMFQNCTPHAILIKLPGGEMISLPPAPIMEQAKVVFEEATLGDICGIPIVKRQVKDLYLPPTQWIDPGDGAEFFPKIQIVSSMVLDACSVHDYVVAPDSGTSAGRENGQVTFVTRLVAKGKGVITGHVISMG